MGSPANEEGRQDDEGPQHRVRIAEPFAVGKFEVTFAEWDSCVLDGGCRYKPKDAGWGHSDRPVIYVSWDDAKTYVTWLSGKSGEDYRLLSEAEWEYAARAGTSTPFYTGRTITTDQANSTGNYHRAKTVAVGTFAANPFGLHDMHGNVWEWVEDCWNGNYSGTPADGSALRAGGCTARVLRGGSWNNHPWLLRSAARYRLNADFRLSSIGFRIARTLKAPSSDNVQALPSSRPQRATYYYQEAEGDAGESYDATVIWANISKDGRAAIRATLRIADSDGKAIVTISKNYDESLPVSHLVEIDFSGSLSDTRIQRVPALVLKHTEQARGQPLAGAAVRVTNTFFWIALSDDEEQVARNIQLLREGSWFDVPILFADQTRALFTFEKGESGNDVFDEVMSAWNSDTGSASASAVEPPREESRQLLVGPKYKILPNGMAVRVPCESDEILPDGRIRKCETN